MKLNSSIIKSGLTTTRTQAWETIWNMRFENIPGN